LNILLLVGGCCHPYNFFNGTFCYEPFTGIVEQLKVEPVNIDVLGFKILWIEDTVLLVSTPRDHEKLVSVYSLHDYRPLFEGLILKGRGPNEHLQASFVSSFTDSAGIKIWFSVDYRQQLICIDLTRSIIDKKSVIIKEIDLSQIEDSFSLYRMSVQCDTSIILEKVFNNVIISTYNPISNKESQIGWLYSEEIEKRNITVIASTGFFYDNTRSMLVSGMIFFNQINFFNIGHPEQSFSISTAKEATHYNIVKQVEVGERPQYYIGPCQADDMLIFGYQNGKTSYEYTSPENNYLYIVNWEGKIERVILLDRPFTGDAFDKYTGYFYGTDNETQEILKYKIR